MKKNRKLWIVSAALVAVVLVAALCLLLPRLHRARPLHLLRLPPRPRPRNRSRARGSRRSGWPRTRS